MSQVLWRPESSILPLLCIGWVMCWVRPRASIVSLKMMVSSDVISSIFMLKSPSSIMFSSCVKFIHEKFSQVIQEHCICCAIFSVWWWMIDSYNMYQFVPFDVLPYGVFHDGCVVGFKLCYIQVFSEYYCYSSPLLVP